MDGLACTCPFFESDVARRTSKLSFAHRVVFERQLDQVPVYIPGPKITDSRTEPMDPGLSRKERSNRIALMIKDAFEEHDRNMVFVVCGSAHAEEIYNVLDKKFTQPFTYISKMSCTD